MNAGRAGHGGWGEGSAEAVEGIEEGGGPGPGSVEIEPAPAGGDADGDVEEPVTDGFGGGASELSGETDLSSPHEQVVSGEAELHPGLVVHDVIERQVREAAGFGVADHVLGSGPSPLEQLEAGDVVVGLVGDERGVAAAFDGVEQRELRSGVRDLAAHDQPRAGRPRCQVDVVGELNDFGSGPFGAVAVGPSW